MQQSSHPILLIINGPPASGKSTLAGLLSQALGLPHLSKDLIKEALFDSLGTSSSEDSRKLSNAAYLTLYRVAYEILRAGYGLILESNFVHGVSEADILPLLTISRPAILHCDTTRETIIIRQERRAVSGERHPGHHDAILLPGVLAGIDAGLYQPLNIPVPLLRIDTTDGYAPDFSHIMAFIRATLITGQKKT